MLGRGNSVIKIANVKKACWVKDSWKRETRGVGKKSNVR
jgi:hypothetical protein